MLVNRYFDTGNQLVTLERWGLIVQVSLHVLLNLLPVLAWPRETNSKPGASCWP